MLRRIYFLLFLICFTTCDDGDIITVELEFDQELDRCDNFEDSYLIYDTREDPNEALLLVLPKPESDYLFTDATETPIQLNIPAEAQFNYRIYNRTLGDGVLCNVLSDPNLVVEEDYEATSGMVEITVSLEDDDNDGIPSVNEGLTGLPNEDGIYTDSLDTDGDGIYDYLDEDDDNDNVKTKDEDDNDDGDNNPFTNPLDTDGDGIYDYLDQDDDNDGVPTRLEDVNENENPRNLEDQVMDEDGANIYRYLYNHPTAMEAFPDSGFIDNTYTRTVTTRFTILNAGLTILSSTVIDFGTFISAPVDFTTEID